MSHFDALVEGEKELPEHKPDILTEVELSIGKQIAENLVVDGATLQMGKWFIKLNMSRVKANNYFKYY